MKTTIRTLALLLGATILGTMLFAGTTASAAIPQTVNQSGADVNGWASAIWGTPAAVASGGNAYVTTNTYFVRTPNNSTPAAFGGQSLQIDSGGTLYLKHNGGAAAVNLLLNGGNIIFHGGTASSPSPLSGTIQVLADSRVTTDQSGSNSRDIWLQSPITGSAMLTVAMVNPTNSLWLSGSNSAYSGNWTNTTGFIQIVSGTTNALGSGGVILVNANNSLLINSTNNQAINNPISGLGSVTKQNTNTVTLGGNNSFTGPLTCQLGLLVLTGAGAQSSTVILTNGVLRIANSAALPYASTLTVSPNNAQTGGLQLSNSVTLSTGNAISVAQRTGPTVAIESVSGNNVISDQVSIFSGGTSPIAIQADAGTTLDLGSGITSGVTGTRGVLLTGAGNGSVEGVIDNGSATTVSLTKDGAGTWTLNNVNYYAGNTVITNGVLKLGASGSLPNSVVIEVDAAGKLDATSAGGLPMAFGQVLRGSGAVLGDVFTGGNSAIEVALTNQYGSLAFSNNLTLAGSDTVRFDVGLVTNDVLNVTGSLMLNGATTIEIRTPSGFANTGTYRLINYSGTLQGGGSFTLVAPSSRQNFALDTATAGQVNLVITGNPTNLVWSGDGSANVWDVGATANWTGQVFYQVDNVTFNDSGSATPEINVMEPVSPGSVTVSNTAKAYTFTNSAITTAFPLVKRGNNVLAFANNGNNFSGPISIEAGTLSIGNGGDAGSLGNGAITNNGQLLLNKSTNGAGLGGIISGPGTVRLTGNANGGGALTLSGANTYTGLTTIETNCQLSVWNNTALGSPSAGTVVQAGGRVGFTSLGNWTVAEPLTINGYGISTAPGALYANTVSNVITLTAPVTIGSDAQIRLAANAVKMTLTNTVTGNQTALQCTVGASVTDTGALLTFSNTLSIGSSATLTKDGPGTMVMGGNNNLCSNIVISAGTLQLGVGGTEVSVVNGSLNPAGSGSIAMFNSANDFAWNKEIPGLGGVTKRGTGTLTLVSNTFTGAIDAQAGTLVLTGPGAETSSLIESNAVLRVAHSAAQQSGVLRVNSFDLQTGRLELSNNVTIPTGVSIELGMRTTTTTALENISGNNTITDPVVISTGGTLPARIQTDSGTSLTLLGGITFGPSTVNPRSFGLVGSGTGDVSGPIDNGTSTNLSLLKDGSGTWTIQGANTYSGTTTIQGGTLALGTAATILNTPAITLLSNATLNVSAVSGGFTLDVSQTLSGNGTVQGNVAANGTLSPGTSVGTLNFANSLVLSGFTVMELNRTNAPNADLIAAAALTFGGVLTVTNLGPDLQAGDSFNLFDGPISGAFSVTNLPALSATNLFWDVSLLQSQGIIRIVSSVATRPTIQTPAVSGTNFSLQVVSQLGFNYVLEATPSLAPTNWVGIQTNAGTGGTLTFTIPISPANPKRFFRINVQ